MNKYLILIICILISSCSSMNSTIVYGGLSGASVGAISGHVLSPDRESDTFNTITWGVVGAFLGAGIAYLLRVDDPDNKEMKQMIRPPITEEINSTSNHDIGFKLITPDSSKSYLVPDQNLPERLKGKVKKQIITEHLIKERIEKSDDGKTLVYPETKVYEYDYQ